MPDNTGFISNMATSSHTHLQDGANHVIHTGIIKAMNIADAGSFVAWGIDVDSTPLGKFDIEAGGFFRKGEYVGFSAINNTNDLTNWVGHNTYDWYGLICIADGSQGGESLNEIVFRKPTTINAIKVADPKEGDIPICVVQIEKDSAAATSRKIQYLGIKKTSAALTAGVENSGAFDENLKIGTDGKVYKNGSANAISFPTVSGAKTLAVTTDIPTYTFGIADTNLVKINDTDAADNDYVKFTATGLEGRSYAEVKSDLALVLGDIGGDIDDISDGDDYKKYPNADKTKVGHLTITGAVNLDTAELTDTQLTETQINAMTIDAATVNDKTVAVNVPSGAVFTDTQLTATQINNMTIDADTVNSKTVATSVPANALFTDTNTQRTDSEIDARAQLKIDALVGAAPDALDTLVEIATSLNDDADLEGTLTTAIGLRAPKASPTFTGTITIPSGESTQNLESVVNTNTAKVTFPGFGTTSTTALVGNTSIPVDLTVSQSENVHADNYTDTKAWGSITGKPTTFAPIVGSNANQAMAGNTSIPVDLSVSQTENVHADNYTDTKAWASITGKPTTFAPIVGTNPGDALAGNTTTISSTQADAITANTAKTGITSTQAGHITANNAKVTYAFHAATDLGTATVIADDLIPIWQEDTGLYKTVSAADFMGKITSAQVAGSGKIWADLPASAATVGAKAGTNLVDSSNASLGDADVKNASTTWDHVRANSSTNTKPADGATVGGRLGSGGTGNIYLENGSTKATEATILNTNTTKANVGLGDVSNITTAAMRAGVTHSDVGTTKADVGLGDVSNITTASMRAGVTHSDVGTTKSDVGLANVANVRQVTTFKADDAPTATAIGDVWIDTNDNNKMYRASATGSGDWEAVTVGKGALGLVKADVGLGSVPNTDMTNLGNAASGTLAVARGGTGLTAITTLLNSNTTKTDVGLANVENKTSATIRGEIVAGDIPNISTAKLTSGTLAAGRGGTGITNFADSTHKNSNTTKSDVGLSNVDNDSTATIRAGTTAANVGLGNVTNESKATMLNNMTITGTITTDTYSDLDAQIGAATEGVKTFKQDAIPTAANAGDLWIDTDDNNKMYRATTIGDNEIGSGEWIEVTLSKSALGLVKADVGLGSVDNDSTATIRAGTTASNVGLGNVTNESKTTMFASPTFTGTVAGVTKTHIGLANVDNDSTATIRSGVTKANVGLSNVDNDSTATIRSGTTAANVGLGNVTNESKATMFADPEFTGTIVLPGITNLKNTVDANTAKTVRTDTEINTLANARVEAILDVDGAAAGLKTLSDISDALSDDDDYAATIVTQMATKTKTFKQDAVPTSTAVGDLWIDTNDNNKIYHAAAVGADQITAGEWVEITANKTAIGLGNVDNDSTATIRSGTTKANVGLGNVDNTSDATKQTNILSAATKSDVGLSNVANVDTTNAANISSGTLAAGRGGTGLTAITTLLNSNTTKSDVGLANVLNQAQTTTFKQDGVPTALAAGDLWVDTDDNNKLYRATAAGDNEVSGSEWIEVTVGKTALGLAKADVGLGNVDNDSTATIRSGTTKANVGLSNVANVDTTNAANISSGTLPASRGGTGLTAVTTLLNSNTTKSDVGLSNVDNDSTATIQAGTTKANVGLSNVTNASQATIVAAALSEADADDVGLGNVTNESKSTMFAGPTFTGTVAGVTKSHVGLSNVDNTTDAAKQTATLSAATKSDVGLANVDNDSTATIRAGTTSANVGLGNVPNVDMRNLSNATSGTVAAARGGTGLSSIATLLNSNVKTLDADGIEDKGGIAEVTATLTTAVNASATLFYMSEADEDKFFSVAGGVNKAGQIIKIGSEYCRLLGGLSDLESSNSNTYAVIVDRGVRGSTAASHSVNASITLEVNKTIRLTMSDDSTEDVVIPEFGGSSAGTGLATNVAAQPGLVPYAAHTDASKYLRGDGSWQTVSAGGDSNAGGVNGSAGAPTFSFASDTNTGMFRLTGDTLGFSVGGSAAMYMQSSKVEANKRFEIIAGSASTPGLSLAGDDNTGIYRAAENKIGFSLDGTEAFRMEGASMVISKQYGRLDFNNSSPNNHAIYFRNNDAYRGEINYNHSDGRMSFKTGTSSSTEHLRITGTGAFGLSGANYGSSGQVLTSAGSGGAPTWTTISGGASAINDLSDGKTQDLSIGLGTNALYQATSGQANNNVAVGANTGYAITIADNNTLVGVRAGSDINANDNVAVGYQAFRRGTGVGNTMLGPYAGEGASGNSSGTYNTFVGYKSGFAYTDGVGNIGLGKDSLESMTGGDYNIALGYDVADSLTSGSYNVLIGREAGQKMTTGSSTVAVGDNAGRFNTGSNNTFVGTNAGKRGTEGSSTSNVFMGHTAGGSNAGDENVAIGHLAFAYGTGARNIAIGKDALQDATGNDNVAIGLDSLKELSSGQYHVGIGRGSLRQITTVNNNTAVGYWAGAGIQNGGNNVALGYDTLGTNNSATQNTAVGASSQKGNTGGNSNTSLGYRALYANTSGLRNIAIGVQALDSATTETDNIAIGFESQYNPNGGDENTSVGNYSLEQITTGGENVAIGYEAGEKLQTGNRNVFIGHKTADETTGSSNNVIIGGMANGAANAGNFNTFIGDTSGLLNTGAKNIAIGYSSGDNITSGSNNVIIGAADIASATGNDQLSISSGDGSPVWITGDSNGNVKLPDGNLDIADNYITTSESNGDVKFKENGTGGFIFYDDDESEYLAIREGGHLQFSLNTAGGSTEQIMQYRDAGGTMRNFMSINSDDLYIHNRAANGKVIIQANTSTAGANDVTAATFEDDKVTFAVQPVLPSSGIKFSDGSEQTVAASGSDGNRLPAIKTLLSNADDKLHLSQAGHMGQVAANFNQNKYPIFMPFYSGAGGTFTKASVVINTGVAGTHVGLCFWSEDSNGKPTTKIGSELSFNAEESGTITLTSQSITLAADTRYWVSWRSHPDSTGNVNFSGYEVAMEPIVMGDQTIPFCNVLFYLSTSAFGSTVSHGSFTSTYRQWWPKMWLEIS